jgi:hypothetical protein
MKASKMHWSGAKYHEQHILSTLQLYESSISDPRSKAREKGQNGPLEKQKHT